MFKKKKILIYFLTAVFLGMFLYFFVEPQYGAQVEVVKISKTVSKK